MSNISLPFVARSPEVFIYTREGEEIKILYKGGIKMLDTAKLTFITKNIPEIETISAETGLRYLYLQLTKIPYCDKIIYSPKRNYITLRLSYPRVFDRTNA